MWIVVCGPTGTGKELIIGDMVRSGFEIIPPTPPSFYVETEKTQFLQELAIFSSRFNASLEASKWMERKDVVTLRTFWESRDVFVPIARMMDKISEAESRAFQLIFNSLQDDHYIPPTAIIYAKTDKMNALNRMKLKNKIEISEDEFNLQVEHYDKFVERVRTPVIELDISLPPDEVRKNLEFGLSSLKAANLVQRTLWTRTFFK